MIIDIDVVIAGVFFVLSLYLLSDMYSTYHDPYCSSGECQMAVANRKIWIRGMTFRVERSARTACSVHIKQTQIRSVIYIYTLHELKKAQPSPFEKRHGTIFRKEPHRTTCIIMMQDH